MNRYSVDEFVSKTQQEDKGEGLFEMETPRLLKSISTEKCGQRPVQWFPIEEESNLSEKGYLNTELDGW